MAEADDIDALLDSRAANKPVADEDIDALLDAHAKSTASAEPAVASQSETPWWQQPVRQIGLAGRAVAQGVASMPMMAMDAGVAARNLATNLAHGETPTLADFNPFAKTGGSHQEYELPSKTFGEQLTSAGLPEPKSTSEKVAGFIESVLTGSRIPGPSIKNPAPAGFVKPAASPSEQVLRDSIKEGYVVPPTTANPNMMNKIAEGLAGKIKTAQKASAQNQEVTNSLVRKALGMQEGEPITPESLKSLRDTAGKVYEQIANAGEIKPDGEYLKDLAQLGRGADEIAQAFPGANVGATKQIGDMVDSLLQDSFSSKAALQYLRELRKQASSNLSGMNAADPSKQALGMAQREAASTLEDLIQRHLVATGRGDIAESFGAARKLIAMSHSVEKALNETTGNVVAGNLTQQMVKGKPLSGELETVAKFGQAFPKAAKEITESMPGASPLDWATAAITTAASHSPLGLAAVAVRPGVRSALLSPWWQKQLTEMPYAGAPETIGIAPSAALQAEGQ